MTSANPVLTNKYGDTWTWDGWCKKNRTVSDVFLYLGIGLLALTTLISLAIAIGFVRATYLNYGTVAYPLLLFPVPILGLLFTVAMFAARHERTLWILSVGLAAIMLVAGFGWMFIGGIMIDLFSDERSIQISLEEKYNGKAISLVHEEEGYTWNGKIVSNSFDDYWSGSVDRTAGLEHVSVPPQVYLGVPSDWEMFNVPVENCVENYGVYRMEGSDNLYVKVNWYKFDAYLEMEKAQ